MKLSDLPIEAIGVGGIYFFTVMMGLAFVAQIREIFRRRSVQTISSSWIIYFSAMFMSGIIYGLTYHRQPVLINNLTLAAAHAVIALGIFRYRGFSRRDWWFIGGLAAALGIMAFSRRQDIWFIAFFPGGVLAILKQSSQIWIERKVGVLNPWLLASFVVSNIFWTAYALVANDWTLQIICPTNLVACSILFGSWWRFRRPSPDIPAIATGSLPSN